MMKGGNTATIVWESGAHRPVSAAHLDIAPMHQGGLTGAKKTVDKIDGLGSVDVLIRNEGGVGLKA